jgi:uncharacterized protein
MVASLKNVEFSPHVIQQLAYYVYRLIDPRNGETFYIGKGKGNRVLDHAKGALSLPDQSSKLNRIREIQTAGFEVQHIIHRHGLTEAVAHEIEAALIDAYPGLTNLVSGRNSQSKGVMHAQQIIEIYEAEEFSCDHRLLMITINWSAAEQSVYDAVRYAWKLDPARAKKADYILAVYDGLVIGVYIADEWLLATPENFEDRPDRSPRYGFRGHEADETIKKKYLRHRVPSKFRRRGAANPVKYSF